MFDSYVSNMLLQIGFLITIHNLQRVQRAVFLCLWKEFFLMTGDDSIVSRKLLLECELTS
jgi:hypothetical protein